MAMGMMLDHLVIFLSNYTAESETLLTVSFSLTFRRPCVAQSWRSSSHQILFRIFIKKLYFTLQVIQKIKWNNLMPVASKLQKGEQLYTWRDLTIHRPPLIISFPKLLMSSGLGKLHSPRQPVFVQAKMIVDLFRVGSDQECRELQEGQDIGSRWPQGRNFGWVKM